ncbi:antirestriction protein ArdA, partial [Shigella sonnei]
MMNATFSPPAVGLLADVPETVALYFDYEAYARDLFLDSFTF